MANCCKIIRLLKEVKRKADSSFCEINEKITKLESKYNLLSQQNEHLKKQVEESKRMVHPAETGGGALSPAIGATVARRKRLGRRRLRNKSKAKSRSTSRRSSHKCVGRKRSARKPVTAARRFKRRGRKPSAKGRKGRFRRRNPCL